VKILTVDGYAFKDLNRNDSLDAYEDWRLSPQERAADLASQLSIEEIAGLMLYSSHQAVPMIPTMGFGVSTYNDGKAYEESGAKASDLSDDQKKFLKDEAFIGTKADWRDVVDTEYNGLVESWNGTYGDSEEGGPSFTSTTEVVQLVETPKFVTFYGEHSSYTGGAHGMAGHIGRTFRKSDGHAMGYETDYDEKFNIVHKGDNLLKDTKSPALYALIKAGVMEYFKACGQAMADEAELADFLQVDDVNRIPLPANAPYLTKTGVVFCYTQYEIAPYAAGMITFEIPFAKISPFLTDEAKALIK
jgi:hypothetical protein